MDIYIYWACGASIMERGCKINSRKKVKHVFYICVGGGGINERNRREKSQSLIRCENFIKLLMMQGIYVSEEVESLN